MTGGGPLRHEDAAGRLDPVRWHRPGRATSLRFATVALLVTVAAAIVWSGPSPCPSGPGPTRASEPSRSGTPHAGSGPAAAGPDAAPEPAPPPAPEPAPPPAREPAPPPRPVAVAAGDRLAVPAGHVGVPLRLSDPATLALVAPGDRVDVLRVDGSGRTAEVASAALVLGVTDADDLGAAGLLVALTPADARRASAEQGRGFAVLLRPG